MTTVGSKYRGSKEFLLVYAKLIAAAQGHGHVSYKEVAKTLGIAERGHHMAREVGQILGEISEDEHGHGRPMLSAIAVGVTGQPGDGFFELARRLGKVRGDNVDELLEFWKAECERVYGTWWSNT